LTVAQNLAIPFSLDIDPIPAATLERVSALARSVGLDEGQLNVRLGEAGELARTRVNLGRAIALDPSALVLEHATARLPASAVGGFASDVVRVASASRLAVVTLTSDEDFGRAVGGRLLYWDPSTGALKEKKGWWKRPAQPF
jgi:ABC-type methionine transport system ATPase subunit